MHGWAVRAALAISAVTGANSPGLRLLRRAARSPLGQRSANLPASPRPPLSPAGASQAAPAAATPARTPYFPARPSPRR
eukprot:6211530-Pleurochrysis_carterae.AAC.4